MKFEDIDEGKLIPHPELYSIIKRIDDTPITPSEATIERELMRALDDLYGTPRKWDNLEEKK